MILTADRVQNLVSYNGTAGHSVRKIQEFTYPWTSNGVLLMHSDGLTTSWRLDAYPGILQHHPTLLAALLYRDANRGRDDALAVVPVSGDHNEIVCLTLRRTAIEFRVCLC